MLHVFLDPNLLVRLPGGGHHRASECYTAVKVLKLDVKFLNAMAFISLKVPGKCVRE